MILGNPLHARRLPFLQATGWGVIKATFVDQYTDSVHSDQYSFCEDIVLERIIMVYRDNGSISDQIYEKKICSDVLMIRARSGLPKIFSFSALQFVMPYRAMQRNQYKK